VCGGPPATGACDDCVSSDDEDAEMSEEQKKAILSGKDPFAVRA
jgi:hypothetical protein